MAKEALIFLSKHIDSTARYTYDLSHSIEHNEGHPYKFEGVVSINNFSYSVSVRNKNIDLVSNNNYALEIKEVLFRKTIKHFEKAKCGNVCHLINPIKENLFYFVPILGFKSGIFLIANAINNSDFIFRLKKETERDYIIEFYSKRIKIKKPLYYFKGIMTIDKKSKMLKHFKYTLSERAFKFLDGLLVDVTTNKKFVIPTPVFLFRKRPHANNEYYFTLENGKIFISKANFSSAIQLSYDYVKNENLFMKQKANYNLKKVSHNDKETSLSSPLPTKIVSYEDLYKRKK